MVKAQADAVGLPLWEVPLPWPCTNQQYEQRMQQVLQKARHEGISHMAFGDLFLSEIRSYREQQLAGTGITPLFPLWTTRELTLKLAQEMIQSGLKAILTCVDPKRLTPSFAGREFDHDLLSELPKGVDPCGENGEFHTFCYAGPMFSRTIPITHGEIVEREGFVFADWLPAS
ncbi:MAG: ATP-binding protein [Gemmataceae bacterium]|nr:ATP-binding protein [Gemmataceae bacterium]